MVRQNMNAITARIGINMKDDWFDIKDKTPPHMEIIRVCVGSENGEYERERDAVFLAFDGNIYDAEEQETIHHVTKWKIAKD